MLDVGQGGLLRATEAEMAEAGGRPMAAAVAQAAIPATVARGPIQLAIPAQMGQVVAVVVAGDQVQPFLALVIQLPVVAAVWGF